MALIRSGLAAIAAALLCACATAGGGNRGDALAVVQTYLAALANENREVAEALFSANAEIVLPFNPNGDAGEAAIRRFSVPVYLGIAFEQYDNLVFVNQRAHIANVGATVFLEATGDLRVARTGTPYRNRYLFRFDVYDGRIERIVEYSNPVTAARQGAAAR